MWREVLRINEATVEGLSQSQLPPTHEQEFYKELRHSNEVFAAFKVHKMGSLMALKLTDEDGKLKSYRQWKEDIKGISNHFLNAWLKTEYNTAVIRAHNAADWRQFERNKDIMPNLRWMPTVSPNPEAEHRVFWERKLTRPIDAPFWNKHRPGNRWNCKCSLEATDDPITPLPTEAEIRGDQPQRGLENNPGKDGQLFSKKHPYFPKNCRECGFNKKKGVINFWGGFFHNGGTKCETCHFIPHKYTAQEKHQIYSRPIDEQFITIEGNIKTHLLKSLHSEDYKQLLNVARFFAPKAKEVQIMAEIHKSEVEARRKFGIKSKNKNADIRIVLEDNSIFWVDAKAPHHLSNVISNANKACSQGAFACVLDDHINTSQHHDLARKIFSDKNYTREYLYVMYGGKLYKYNSQGLIEVLG